MSYGHIAGVRVSYISFTCEALHQLYDHLEFKVRSLKSLEVPVDSYGNLLSSLLMNRLPQEFCLIVTREIGGGEWKIN